MMRDIPHVPPRPQRDRNNQTSSICSEPPKIPPRPIERRSDRSISPHSVSITLSSPYEIPLDQKKYHENSIAKSESYELFDAEISRPPSVKLPSLGQEGIEYADAYATEMDIQDKVFTESQNVEIGHKNYASNPSIKTPSLEGSDSMMPSTDSIEGLQKEKQSNANNTDSNENQSHSLPASQTTGRNLSNASIENGIPKIGQIVPMYPNAGDVQAPSQSLEPSLATSTLSCDGATQSKHHGRRHSGRPHDILSDAYGRFGHGVISHDRFDKEYYKKHPELFQKESRPYGEDRSEWALSSEDLNKIVRNTASRISIDGGSDVNFGTPSEQIGFQASEEYASRLSSRPSLSRQITNLSSSELKNELPLKTDLSMDNTDINLKYTFNELEHDMDIDGNHMEDNNIIHVDDPIRSIARVHGDHEDDAYLETAEKVSTNEENDRLGYGAPILAPDEVAKEPLLWELKPAVSPLNDNAKTSQEESLYPPETDHQANLTQKSSLISTANEYSLSNLRPPSEPLEQLDEYEPLFPEEVKSLSCEPKSMKLVERLKRSEVNRRFPSQDVWEDTPNSLQYTATVSTLQSPEEEKNRGNRDENFERDTETLAHAFAKRQEELAQQEMDRFDKSLPMEKPKKKFTAVSKMEPVTSPKFPNQRFPSRDIWEDTPDSLLLQTTVAGPQIGKDNLNLSEEQPDPTTAEEGNCKSYEYPLNNKGNRNTETSPALKSLSADELLKSKSSDNVEQFHSTKPERPAKSLQMHFTERSSSPGLTKPKPQVPARPSKPLSRESSDNLNQKNPPIPVVSVKNKPSVPSRPAGSKIAALQGNFMSDLSKRLQLGPQVSKKDVPKAEQQQEEDINTPLTDVRKCRARGPARRAPVRAQIVPTPKSIPMGEFKPLKISIVSTIWVFDPKKENLQVLPSDVGQGNDKISIGPMKI